MITALTLVFWLSLVLLLHTYLFYPLLMRLFSTLKGKAAHTKDPAPAALPHLSILMAAYNEEKVIREKLESIFSSDYPAEKIEVIVGSDASTDQTNTIVRSFSKVRLVEFRERSGKVKIINQLVSMSRHDLLILTDANVLFDRNTLKHLARHFSDPATGLVDTLMINTNQHGTGVSHAESTYIRGESGIKRDEGNVFGTMIGPFGGCFAVRRSFFEPVPEHFLVDDFYISMKVLEKGGRTFSDPNAIAYEKVPSDWKVEFRRKIRIATGSFQNLLAFFPLLFRFDAVAFCFFSHKVLRWKGPFLMILLFFSNLGLLLTSPNQFRFESLSHWMQPYPLFFLWICFVPFLFLLDLILKAIGIRFVLTRLITHFLTTNLAIFIGFFRFLKGVRSSIWQPTARH